MTDRQPQLPMWLRGQHLTAAGIGLLATGMAWLGWSATPALRTSIDWGFYDRWVQQATLSPADSAVVLITRDAAADARFGAGSWDRALIARLISAVHDGGAAVIGVDLNLLEPSPPQRGGPASDAQLAEATSLAGNVIYPLVVEASPHLDEPRDGLTEEGDEVDHPSWVPLNSPPQTVLPFLRAALPHLPLTAHHAKGIGHVGAIADPDRTVRRTPLFLTNTHHAVPAFGLLLAAAYYNVPPSHLAIRAGSVMLPNATSPTGDVRTITIPIDRQGAILSQDPGDGRAPRFSLISFEDVWNSIEPDDPGRLRPAVAGKIAVLFPASTTGSAPTVEGMAPEALKRQLYLLNTILTGRWATGVPERWSFMLSAALAGLMAWLTLRGSGWNGLMTALGALALFVGITVSLLWITRLIIPMAVPLSGGLLAMAFTLGWDRLTTAHRLRWLERDRLRAEQALLAVREALTIRESAVEALEEDLETFRQTLAQSAGQQAELARTIEDLRSQTAEAQAQETEARARLAMAEQTIRALQAAAPATQSLSDHGQECAREECAELGILTQDPAVLGLFRTLKKAARSSLPILLLGEPGTGKELFARAAHRLSPRAQKPFLAVNMAAVSPELFESELFGHVRGSFTGAVADRKGLFELAHQGTLFLDEIGDLRLDHQSKLLRVLQDKTFYRVGATTATRVDVRIVAATNKDLRQGVSEGWFREDLYFRLQGLVLQLPPLRHRRGDIPLLAQSLLRAVGAQMGRPDLTLTREALDALLDAEWKGNVRELAHCLEQAVVLAEGTRIGKADLRLAGRDAAVAPKNEAGAMLPDAAGDAAVLATLQEHRFDMQATARALRWDRGTVTQRLKGLGFQALVDADGDLHQAAQALAGHPALMRVIELKLRDYYDHLVSTIQGFETPQAAISHCQRRFKNLPERHFRAVERLIHRHFTLQQIQLPISRTGPNPRLK